MKTALILAGALIPGPLLGYEVKGNTMIFTDAEMQQCAIEGGCQPVSYKWFQQRMEEAKNAGRQDCKGGT